MSNVQDKKLEDQITKLTSDLDAAKQRIAELTSQRNTISGHFSHLEMCRDNATVRAEAAERNLAWALRTLRTVRHLVVGVSCCEQCFKCHQNAEMYLPIIDEALTQIEREPARASETKHAQIEQSESTPAEGMHESSTT